MLSMTPDQFRKVGLGVTPSPSPFLTPRPERRRPESRGSEWNTHRQDKDKEVNVQVLLRCRPLIDEEQKANVPKVIACNELKREVTVASKQVDRVFSFDKVFGPKAQQRSIYDQAISPIVNEVLDGFNCTVFAYGQTGTGKTYTMEGGLRNKGGDLPAEAGVIPRAVRQIFDTLEAQNADYSLKVTFLELYNEEITDLLAREDNSRSTEDRQKKPISLMEDGKGCVVVRGLEEEAVYSANEIYTLLEQGSAKRRTADTLLNKRSSRSHSVFSITVYVKEAAVGDEELIKCGKLNLVDLAGSENISRSGAREARAREAGEINKSLLTLGRVINALVEHSAHVPYRDSKLTRLLRDSLGGKTKTCIIATISPSAHSLEETLSTLDYAYRAKNIKNKPEANQKMSKAVLLKDLYLEIERMKEDVRAAREKNGVYVPYDRFSQDEAEKKLRNERIEQLENDLSLTEKQVHKYRELYHTEQEQKLDVECELKDCKINLEKSNKELLDLQENHKSTISTLKEKEFLISKMLHSENSLIDRAKELRNDLRGASEDITALFSTLDEKDKMEAENQNMVLTFGSQLDKSLKSLHKTILWSVSQQQQHLRCLEENLQSFLASKSEATNVLESRINRMRETHNSGVAALKGLADSMHKKASSDLEEMNMSFSSQMVAIDSFFGTALVEAKEVIEEIQGSLDEHKQLIALSTRQQEEGLQRSLTAGQAISLAMESFLSDLNHQASKIVAILGEKQIQQSNKLENFERMFKEEAAREEKQALEDIGRILMALTTKKTASVSRLSKDIQNLNTQENKQLHQEISKVKQVSSDAKDQLTEYVENVNRHFTEDTFAVAESRVIMQNVLQESSNRVDYSRKQWEEAQSYINNFHNRTVLEMESSLMERIGGNDVAHEEFLSVSSAVDADYDARAGDVTAAVNDSLARDKMCKKQLDSITSMCLDQLKYIPENHADSISSIRNDAEKCLLKDYKINQNSSSTPKRKVIVVPSLASIEEMRTPVRENHLKEENNSDCRPRKWRPESKIPQPLWHAAASPDRPPFTDVNERH